MGAPMDHSHMGMVPRGPSVAVQQCPWPLAPVTVPVVLVVVALLMGPVGHLVLSRIPFAETFDLAGSGTFAFVYTALMVAGLVLISCFSTPRPPTAVALVGVGATALVGALVAVVVHQASSRLREPPVGTADLFTTNPGDSILVPYATFARTMVDPSGPTIDWDNRGVIALSALLAWAALLAVVGAGGGFASGGGLRTAVGAGLGGAVGGFIGAAVQEVAVYEWPESFFSDGGQSIEPTVLLRLVIAGACIGGGAMLANLERARAPIAATPPPPTTAL